MSNEPSHHSADSIEQEDEDIFASPKQEKEENAGVKEESDDKKTEQKDEESEQQAAAALTSLVGGSPTHEDNEEDEDEEDQHEEGGEGDKEFKIPQRFTKSGRRRAVPFPLKLMKVLECKEYSDIIAWLPSGKSFNIIKPKVFTAEILPTHFKSAKYSSFTRKLHRWGFMRHYRGEEAGAFFHKNFQKGRLDLVEKMTCYKPEPPKRILLSKPRLTADGSPVLSPTRSMHHQSRMMPGMGVPIAPNLSPTTARPDLNAAIEMEVARRLRERIDAASMSRQALVMMQQKMPVAAPPGLQQPNYMQYMGPGLQGFGSQGPAYGQGLMRSPGMPTAGIPMSQMGFKIDQQLPSYNFGDATFNGMPAGNIQGAKTA